jgi:hypothetical protein
VSEFGNGRPTVVCRETVQNTGTSANGQIHQTEEAKSPLEIGRERTEFTN